MLSFLTSESTKDPKRYLEFYLEYANFLKEGVCTDFDHRKDIAKLLRFDSSLGPKANDGVTQHFGDEGSVVDKVDKDRTLVSLDDYISRLGPGQTSIYYLSAPSRAFALSSPYYESFQARGAEVLFCYSAIDEFVMRNLEEYGGRKIVSVDSVEAAATEGEKKAGEEGKEEKKGEVGTMDEADEKMLLGFVQRVLEGKVSEVRVSTRLTSSPALIVNSESAAMRKMLKYVEQEGVGGGGQLSKQRLEVNARHPIMQGVLAKVKEGGEEGERVGRLVMEQVFDNACVQADLMDNPRVMLSRLNELMLQALQAKGAAAAASQPAEAEVVHEEVKVTATA